MSAYNVSQFVQLLTAIRDIQAAKKGSAGRDKREP